MAKIVATNKDDKRDAESFKLLIGASNVDDNPAHYLERPENILVMLIEDNDWKFGICLARFPAWKPLKICYGHDDFCASSRGTMCGASLSI